MLSPRPRGILRLNISGRCWTLPPHSLLQRTARLITDAATDPDIDLHSRWAKIVDDGLADSVIASIGDMPVPSLSDIPIADAVNYAGRDADATLRLYPILKEKVAVMGLERAVDLDISVIPMVSAMCRNGMLVDQTHLAILNEVFNDNLFDLESRIYDVVGKRFLITSGDQVADVLYGDLNLIGQRQTKSRKRLSTDEKALQALQGQHPVIPLLLEHREISKLQSSYVHKLPDLISPDGRIRMELGMSTVPSGRFNCWGGVNLLAIPVRSELGREIRRCFIAPPGCMMGSLDLNQIELRALAILSGDDNMIDAFATGKDLHRLTAASRFHVPFEAVTSDQRQRGKTLNFAIANQITAPGLYDQYVVAGIANVDVGDVQEDINSWFLTYPGVAKWFDSVYEEGRRQGYIRSELAGRILWTPGLRSPIERVESEAKRVATNWKIQTFAQEIIKMGMAQLWDLMDKEVHVKYLLQVHDELLFEDRNGNGPDWGDAITEIVTGAAPELPIPIIAGMKWASNWAELK